ncbi:Uncharacterized protein FWK35_00032328 [Aphis craccivora]|uniref:Uncharacterized protein n=1 Tax=Aphis craccivora TaxID=307492 RepID=A0A6G0VV38_APHCR|nr:Uncharacterized protein FWK35_00032328 [Aphis craccivora]
MSYKLTIVSIGHPIILQTEAKHKVLKSIANSIPCRINLGYTLSYKLQLQMVMRFLTNASLGDSDLKVGLGKEIHPSLQFPGNLIVFHIHGWNIRVSLYILVGKSKIPFFLLKPVYTYGFDSHFHAYEIKIDNSDIINYTELIGCYISKLSNTTPTIARTIGNFKTYATLRYAI